MTRTVVWFSCGVASACAAKLAAAAFENVRVVYCDTLSSEHPDNLRFLGAVEQWVGLPVVRIRSRAYATVDEVFEGERYMAGIAGAKCTVELKKVPRFEFQRADDLHVFGFTADEAGRIRRFEANNPELALAWPLQAAGLTKAACHAMLAAAGIPAPAMYALGFRNNNCLGCVKATTPAYWDRTRRNFPAVFARRAAQSRALGVKLVRLPDRRRLFLDELPEIVAAGQVEPDIECGPICAAGGGL